MAVAAPSGCMQQSRPARIRSLILRWAMMVGKTKLCTPCAPLETGRQKAQTQCPVANILRRTVCARLTPVDPRQNKQSVG